MSVRAVQPSRRATRGTGFTLIELVAVVAILVVLASLLLPAIALAQRSALATRCASNLRQIGFAAQAYESDHEGMLVPTRSDIPNRFNGYTYWWMALAEYAEEEATAGSAASHRVLRGCPAWPTSAFYRGTPGLVDGTYTLPTGYGETAFTAIPVTGRSLIDSMGSYTVAAATVTETTSRPFFADCPRWFLWAPWEIPGTPYYDNYLRHGRRCNALFFDGHVASLAKPDLDAGQMLP